MKKTLLFTFIGLISLSLFAQDNNYNHNKFRQLKDLLATPNAYRTASGAPGFKYYQQKASYVINVTLNDNKQTLAGNETITYKNNSPDKLSYLWLQLDQNIRAKNSDTKLITTNRIQNNMSFSSIAKLHNNFDGGFKLQYVKNGSGKDLKYTINKTMMRVDLPTPLAAGATTTLKIKWWYNINDRDKDSGRSGYEYFPKDNNYLYTIAQFYPRMVVYNDVEGWQNKQFLGEGEFTLNFGDFKVNITVPADHIVAATGTLQNASSVLTATQRERFKKAQSSFDNPVMIVTQKEAEAKEKTKAKATKTWTFSATNVRDFAFASSRKFIWDAMSTKIGKYKPLAMSFYPKEGNPLWKQYSTKVIAHTLKSYSKYTVDYPYPVAIAVHAKNSGMEYPMICFNGGRPNSDGTYSKRTKDAMIEVIIHEVGHNFFPMLINSDERQWTWMDEGLNTFVEYLTEQSWDAKFPSRRGPASTIVDYMRGDKKNMTPIMTNSESLLQFGNNAYGKTAAALNILRETIMGRKLFDFAFKTYAQRWEFKSPTPADLFRTMEDASGVDLDWFWRGWFFTTDHVDISLKNITMFKIDTQNPDVEKALAQQQENQPSQFIGDIRNKKEENNTAIKQDTSLNDFYTTYNPFDVTSLDEKNYQNYLSKLDTNDIKILKSGFNYYNITFKNKGGLVMPILLTFTFKDGSFKEVRIPAEIWKKNDKEVSKIFFFKKELAKVEIDKHLETADVDTYNNNWPRIPKVSKFKLYQQKKYGWGNDGSENAMEKAQRVKANNK